MFFAANEYGQAVFQRVFHAIPIESTKRLRSVARFLDVTEATLKRWLSGESNPPRAAVYALWHESPYGLAVTSAHAVRGWQTFEGLSRAQASEIDRMKAHIAELARELDEAKQTAAAPMPANDPDYGRQRIAAHMKPRADTLR